MGHRLQVAAPDMALYINQDRRPLLKVVIPDTVTTLCTDLGRPLHPHTTLDTCLGYPPLQTIQDPLYHQTTMVQEATLTTTMTPRVQELEVFLARWWTGLAGLSKESAMPGRFANEYAL
jgi:hypothetical protein